ncbi:MAG: hypothetical protein ACLUNO_01040 [Oscillospiraceae bacterium]
MAVYWILRLICVIGVMVMTIIRRNYESTFVCVLVLILFMLPRFVERNFRIELPSTLEIIILVFIFAAEILGELRSYFITYPHWDSALHTTTGLSSRGVQFRTWWTCSTATSRSISSSRRCFWRWWRSAFP